MDELDAATLAAYRKTLENAALVLAAQAGDVPRARAVQGATSALFAAIERREARERAAMEIVRAVAENTSRLGCNCLTSHREDCWVPVARALLKGEA